MIKRLFVLVCFWTLCLRAFALLPLQQTVQDWGNNESATDKNTFPSAFDSVEFQLGRSFQVPGVVYRFGQNPTMHASIYNPNFAGGTGTIVMDQAQMVSNGVTTNLLINGASSYSYPATWTSHSTVTTPDVTITGLSDIVQSGTIQVRVGVVNAFTTVASGPVQLKYYRVLRAPTGHMSLVWLDMLDRSCAWSNGMTTDLQCENANTPALFSAGIFTYPGEPYPTTWIDSTDNKYKLKALFNASGIQSGNCADVSSFLQLSLQALGVTISTTQIFAASNDDWVTYKLCSVGSNKAVDSNYNRIIWTWHQVCTSGSNVWDSCLALYTNLSGATYKNTPYNWSLSGYWHTPTGGSSPMFWGLVSRYAHYPADDSGIDPTLPDESVTMSSAGYSLSGVK